MRWKKTSWRWRATIGLPLEQKFDLSDKAPYAAFDQIDVDAAIQSGARQSQRIWRPWWSRPRPAEEQRKAATADSFPTFKFDGDYGDIGVNVGQLAWHRERGRDIEFPALQGVCAARRGADCAVAARHAARAIERYECAGGCRRARRAAGYRRRHRSRSKWRGRASTWQIEALSEAQQRYANGVSDNLAVSQAQQSVAQANDQYVSSLYRHNVAKLSLARALGAGQDYKKYLGGK